MIRARLFDVFGKPARGEDDPDLCVAMGAAIQGAALAGEEVSAVLVDVTPYTFGTSAIGELDGENVPLSYVPIIHKNTRFPVRKSEAFPTRSTIINRASTSISIRERTTTPWRTSRSANSRSRVSAPPQRAMPSSLT